MKTDDFYRSDLYRSPEIEIIPVKTEQGFAASNDFYLEDLYDGGEI